MQLQITISICQSEAGKKGGVVILNGVLSWGKLLGKKKKKKRTCPDGQSLKEYEMNLKEVKQKMIK